MKLHRLRTVLFCSCTVLVTQVAINCDLFYPNNAYQAMTIFLREEAEINNQTMNSVRLAAVWSSFLSMSFFSLIFSALSLPLISDSLGRKGALILCILGAAPGRFFSFLSYVLTNKNWLFVGRFWSCYFDWTFLQLVPLFLTEICEPEVRGQMNSIVSAAYVIGTVVAVTLGLDTFFGTPELWAKGYLFFCFLGLLPLPGAIILKETPAFLAANGARDDEILDSLIYYYGGTEHLEEIKIDAKNGSEDGGACKESGRMLSLITVRFLWISILVAVFMAFGYGTMGLVSTESTIMLTGVGFSHLSASYLTVFIKIFGAIIAVIVIFISEKLDRRIQFMSYHSFLSIWIAAVSFSVLLVCKLVYDKVAYDNGCGNGYLTDVNLNATESGFTLFGIHNCSHSIYGITFALALLMEQFSSSFGVRPLFWLLVTEIFPLHYRASAKGLSYLAYGIYAFAAALLFGPAMEGFGGWAYILLVVPVLLCATVCQFLMPETRAKHTSSIFQELATPLKTPTPVSDGIFKFSD